jgi:hypothetical protein
MSISKQEFTDAGRSMLGRAQNGERLTISKLVAGSGLATQPSDLWPLTHPIAEEHLFDIATKRDYGQGTMLVEGSFRSDAVGTAFLLRELGVYAHIGTEADRLYSIANVFTDTPDNVDPASPSVHTFKVKLIIDRIPTASLVVSIGVTEAVTGENVGADTVGPGPYKEAVGNVLRFKRFIEGPHVDITEDVDENTITIGVKVLQANLDLYVPMTYPGITDPTKLFPTIQDALDSVADLVIPPDKFVTVHVYSGRFTQNTSINVTHPNASQIKIIGLDVIARAVTGTIAVAGPLPNVEITLTLTGGNTGLALNDIVYLHDAPHGQIESCGYVSALVSTTGVKVRMRLANLLPPTSLTPQATTKLLFFPTQFSGGLAAGTYMFNCATGIGLLKNFGLRSTTPQVGHGVGLFGNAVLENVAAVSFNTGIGTSNGVTHLKPVCAANGCQVGVSAGPAGAIETDAVTLWQRVSWSGCLSYGVWIVGGSYTGGKGTYTYVCGNATGIRADTQGLFLNGFQPGTTGGIVVAFNDKGVVATALGMVLTALTALNNVFANITFDCVADAGAQIAIVHNVNQTGLYSPANRVLGPSGGYVNVQSP